jgi:hypothetical protein
MSCQQRAEHRDTNGAAGLTHRITAEAAPDRDRGTVARSADVPSAPAPSSNEANAIA